MGFAERMVSRVSALDDALEATRNSRVALRLVAPAPAASGADGRRYRSLTVAVAAAAAIALSIGALPGREGERSRLDARHRSERLLEDRSVASGGNPAIDPEAGANGVW